MQILMQSVRPLFHDGYIITINFTTPLITRFVGPRWGPSGADYLGLHAFNWKIVKLIELPITFLMPHDTTQDALVQWYYD